MNGNIDTKTADPETGERADITLHNMHQRSMAHLLTISYDVTCQYEQNQTQDQTRSIVLTTHAQWSRKFSNPHVLEASTDGEGTEMEWIARTDVVLLKHVFLPLKHPLYVFQYNRALHILNAVHKPPYTTQSPLHLVEFGASTQHSEHVLREPGKCGN
ncbi:hypothetical protein V5O48_017393 [Marasmius crinis-equi]|uniref:Uncharacterized protein n=1 Tax=Marasmius crinis-equi TaxID=585013 RepID=A0ABR3EP55_9AGAR